MLIIKQIAQKASLVEPVSCDLVISRSETFIVSHLHSQQVSETNLSDVVADELVVEQARVSDIRVTRLLRGIGLIASQYRFDLNKAYGGNTIFTPAKDG